MHIRHTQEFLKLHINMHLRVQMVVQMSTIKMGVQET